MGDAVVRRRQAPEQIIGRLREAGVVLAQGQSVAQVCRALGVTEQTYWRWRKKGAVACGSPRAKRPGRLEG